MIAQGKFTDNYVFTINGKIKGNIASYYQKWYKEHSQEVDRESFVSIVLSSDGQHFDGQYVNGKENFPDGFDSPKYAHGPVYGYKD